jgi:hypothetical protein
MIDVQSLVKYLLEGLAVAAAAYYIPQKTANLQEIGMIAVTAAAVFAVLDLFAPAVSGGARQGAGFGIGYNITSGLEGFSDDESDSEESCDEETDSDESDDDLNNVEPVDNIENFASIL